MKSIRMLWLRLNKVVWYFLGGLHIEALDKHMLKEAEKRGIKIKKSVRL